MNQLIPVGTIVPYTGDFSNSNKLSLKSQGWLPCDGMSYTKKEFIDLFLSIESAFGGTGGYNGNFNVPDLRGVFIRGVSGTSDKDPNAQKRQALKPGGNTGNRVGSFQKTATGSPHIPFGSNKEGAHVHNVPNAPENNNAYAIAGSHYGLWNNSGVTTSSAGNHYHELTTGFDKESRSINTYVNFIIKSEVSKNQKQ